MTDAAPTLNDIFRHERESTSSVLVDSEKLAAVADNVSREAGRGHAGALAEEAAEKLPALLDVPIGTILARAWSTGAALSDFLEEIGDSGDEPVRLPLLEHTIVSRHHPSVEVLVNEKIIDTLDFEIELRLTLKGAVLEACHGAITGIHVGECIAAGEVKFEGVTLLERALAPLELPGAIELERA